MKQTIFYSWQSDLPNPTNRGFIQGALESAAAVIAADASVEIEPVVDRDTQGVAGSPDISSTIFSKINSADAFVADVSIIARTEGRPTPNPNVLIELGYALKAITHENVILVFNKAYGRVEELPFDLRARRVLVYDMPFEEKARSPERKTLEKQFEGAIRAALKSGGRTEEPPSIPALSVIESQAPNRLIVLRRNLADLLKSLDQTKPRVFSEECTIDEFIDGLRQTQEQIAQFSKIVEMIAIMSDLEAAVEVVRWFGNVFERFNHPRGFSGSFRTSDHDYFKFLGHEMFVTFIAFLLREQRWSILEAILDEPIPLRYMYSSDGPGSVTWVYGSTYLPSLIDESTKRQRMSLHADFLKERHTTGGLEAVLPIEEFVAADFLLFLLGETRKSDESGWSVGWRPWSVLYLKSTPYFLVSAERKKIAEQMVKVFKLNGTEELKKRILESAANVGQMFSNGFWLNPIKSEIIARIGTK